VGVPSPPHAGAPAHTPGAGPAPRARARIRTILVAGIALAALTLAAGRVVERARLGASDAEARQRVVREVTDVIAARVRALQVTARSTGIRASQLEQAATDPEAARALFERLGALLGVEEGRGALTAYGPATTPLAWSGRPSELPVERVGGPAAVFVVPGIGGPRLVAVEPIVDPANARLRSGAIAAEQVLDGDVPTTGDASGADAHVLTSLVPVAVRTPYEGAGGDRGEQGVLIAAPDGRPLLEVVVDPATLAAVRVAARSHTWNAVLAVLAITCLVAAVPFLARRDDARTGGSYATGAVGAAVLLVAARGIALAAVPADWWWTAAAPQGPVWLRPLVFRSPADFVATSLVSMGLVWIAGEALERWRHASRHPPAPSGAARTAAFVLAHLLAGAALVALFAGHSWLVERAFAGTPLDPEQFSLHPFAGQRLTFVAGILVLHAAVFWSAVLLLRGAALGWRVARHDTGLRLLAGVSWVAPFAILVWVQPRWGAPLVGPVLAAVLAAALARRAVPRLRRASQVSRLVAWFFALAAPSVVFYPAMIAIAQGATERLITADLAPEALAHRTALQGQLRRSLAEIDGLTGVVDLLSSPPPAAGEAAPTDNAFLVWRQTDLARLRLTSSVELYGADGLLLSRFALNLPAEAAATVSWKETGCRWDIFGEPLAGTDDRVLLHAGRGLCVPGSPRPAGAILVHVMLDYATLPFLAGQNPYGELGGRVQGDAHARRIEFAMYGWGRTPIFPTEGSAWPISGDLLGRIYQAGRQPLWASVERGDRAYHVYFMNDRSGIYAIGYPLPRAVDHLIALAETLALAGVVYVALVLATGIVARLGGFAPATGRALLREIRGSFYRKLFIAFVLAAVIPVLALALLTRAYIAAQLRDSIESAAGRTASVAKRVVENVASQQRRDSGAPLALTDEIMVGVSRVINEDVNVFTGNRLLATSQRDLFASGRLPTRTPAEVYRAIVLERQASYVGEERIGAFPYMVAAAPVRDGDTRTILTVPLAFRQQETERDIDALDQRVLLATVCFVLLGAAIGYYMAERIADPVNRLTRATRRIARGDLDARIVTSSADELRRLVEAFNGMAADLQRQRVELERSNRLAAWADMARQVAHDIKNPLTPIQLSAEHLRRVSHDRGEPLGPVLDSCVDTILSQVRLLRQISSEFSSFASNPVARFAPTSVNDVVEEVLAPYRTAPAGRVTMATRLAAGLPALSLDRTLLGRALVNIVENALHAMPGGGTLTVATALEDGEVALEVTDTGVGMDDEARERLFEPYFSTRASGTGLGLTIAKRNVELNRGTIGVESAPGRGTTVRLAFGVDA
jgi:signal transduction histidine kinase